MTQNANPGSAYFSRGGLEIVDCVMAIFLFEIYRLFRSGRSLYSKDQYQFKILYFFSRLKQSKVMEDKKQPLAGIYDENGDPEVVRKSASNVQDSENEDDLCQLIDQLRVECKKGGKNNSSSPPQSCVNCRLKTKENTKFINLYKQLIEDIVKSIVQ